MLCFAFFKKIIPINFVKIANEFGVCLDYFLEGTSEIFIGIQFLL